jgi:Holliday junction DNA helicase RuvA
MIGYLRGKLIEKQPPFLLLDVGGVGYEVQAPMTTFYQLPPLHSEVTLYTHLSIAENLHQLFGFIEQRDRALFRTLIKVNGVGPKMAVAIMSGMESDDFARHVRDDNTAALTKVPGVGKKTAERLVIELRDRLKDWTPAAAALGTTEALPLTVAGDALAEAESALIALGYKPAEASKMVALAARQQSGASSEALIRLALRSLSSS